MPGRRGRREKEWAGEGGWVIKVRRCRGVRLRKGSEGIVREGRHHILYLRRRKGRSEGKV